MEEIYTTVRDLWWGLGDEWWSHGVVSGGETCGGGASMHRGEGA